MPRVPSNTGSYVCTQCGMRFSRNSELNRHIQGSHERSLRYGCTECLHTTAQKSNMSRHMLSKHGVTGTPLVIDMRSMASTSQSQLAHNSSASSFNFDSSFDWDFRQLEIPPAASQPSSPQNTAAFQYSPSRNSGMLSSDLTFSQAEFDALLWYSALSVASRSCTAAHPPPHSSESPSRYPHRSS